MKQTITLLVSIAILLIAISLSNSTAARAARYDVQVRGELSTEIANKAFEDACKILEETTEYVCDPKLAPAAALSADLPEGNWGIYVAGGRVVYLNQKLVGPHFDVYAYGVLVHEMVHYISYWSGFGTTQCEDEALAWSVFNTYVRNQNRMDLLMKNWIRGYPKCQNPSSTR